MVSGSVGRDVQLVSGAMLGTCRVQEMNFPVDVGRRSEFCRVEESERKKSKKARNLLVEKTYALQVTI